MFSENSGFSPQIIHLNRVFHYFHHPFWGTTIFGNTHIVLQSRFLDSNLVTQAGYHKVFCSVAVRGGVNVLTFPEGHWMGTETRQVHQDRKMAVYLVNHCWWLKSGKLTSWGKGSWNPIIYTWFYTSPNLKVCFQCIFISSYIDICTTRAAIG